MSVPVQREELATLQFLIANYFPTKDAAQAQAVLSRMAAIAAIEAQGVPDGGVLQIDAAAYALSAIDALRAQIGQGDMQIRVLFECVENGVTGTTSAPVKRVEGEDDGTLTVVLDYWPPPAPQDKRCPLCKYQHGHQIGCENNPVDIALKAQVAVVQQEPMASAMTAQRAAYFMERFKREEKLLGPNEQAAVDFVLAMLNTVQPAKPQPLSDEQLKQMLAAEYNRGWADCEATHDSP